MKALINIAKEILAKKLTEAGARINSTNDKVNDQNIGTFEIKSGKVCNLELWATKEKRELKNLKLLNDTLSTQSVVIVLESPHIDEYLSTKLPPSPALGVTGVNLQKYLPQKLGRTVEQETGLPEGEYKIILCNAIQYQASVGYSTEIYRDRIWMLMWIFGGRKKFIKRMILYHPRVIINSCTKGSHKDDPLFSSNSLAEKENIRKSFIESVFGEIHFVGKELKYRGINIYNEAYLEKNLNYTLRGFVSTAIFAHPYLKCKKIYHSSHPSSAHYKNSRAFERIT